MMVLLQRTVRSEMLFSDVQARVFVCSPFKSGLFPPIGSRGTNQNAPRIQTFSQAYSMMK